MPDNFNLGEQAEVYITTVRLPQALLVPEAAIEGLGNNRGTVWTVEDGHLQQREVTLGHRLLDGRYEITGGVPDKAVVVTPIAQRAARRPRRHRSPRAKAMNLAYRDIKHNLLRFVLTNFGLSLLLGIVIMITGVYGGLIDDALRQARAANADLWVVAGRHQRALRRGFAHPRRYQGVGQPGLWRRARRFRHLSIGPDRAERQAAPPLPHRLRAGPARRPAQACRPGATSCAAITK